MRVSKRTTKSNEEPTSECARVVLDCSEAGGGRSPYKSCDADDQSYTPSFTKKCKWYHCLISVTVKMANILKGAYEMK